MKQNLLKLGMICLMLVFSFIAKAVDIKEKAIYSTDFSEWKDASATKSESKVTVKNKYTKEAFDFILYNTIISFTNKQTPKLGEGWRWQKPYHYSRTRQRIQCRSQCTSCLYILA